MGWWLVDKVKSKAVNHFAEKYLTTENISNWITATAIGCREYFSKPENRRKVADTFCCLSASLMLCIVKELAEEK